MIDINFEQGPAQRTMRNLKFLEKVTIFWQFAVNPDMQCCSVFTKFLDYSGNLLIVCYIDLL